MVLIKHQAPDGADQFLFHASSTTPVDQLVESLAEVRPHRPPKPLFPSSLSAHMGLALRTAHPLRPPPPLRNSPGPWAIKPLAHVAPGRVGLRN
eukprot:COSAG01_NODE_2509_length_7549_cov_22.865235_5_plen_94_part_00